MLNIYNLNFITLAICRQPCLNSGRCIGPNRCACPFGYSGLRCELGTFSCLANKQVFRLLCIYFLFIYFLINIQLVSAGH